MKVLSLMFVMLLLGGCGESMLMVYHDEKGVELIKIGSTIRGVKGNPKTVIVSKGNAKNIVKYANEGGVAEVTSDNKNGGLFKEVTEVVKPAVSLVLMDKVNE